MQTIRYEEVEGNEIVIGFDSLQIDPISTKQKALEKINETDITERIAKARAAVQEAESVKEMFQKATVAKKLQALYHKTFNELRAANPIYFECRKNEKIPTAKQMEKIKKAIETLKENEMLTTGGKIIKKPKE